MLDLGSGGGIDVLRSTKPVGPSGKAYGLDMTDEMLAPASWNKRKGAENVGFLKGEIQRMYCFPIIPWTSSRALKRMNEKKRVLIVCTGSSAPGQMADQADNASGREPLPR